MGESYQIRGDLEDLEGQEGDTEKMLENQEATKMPNGEFLLIFYDRVLWSIFF